MSFLLKNWKFITGMVVVFLVTLYLQNQINQAKEMAALQNKVEKQQEYIEDRKGIDNATESVRGIDSDAALKWLSERKRSATE